jgi:ring-1,2-phenylacetyl-CoA epoxidase subunit PaaD
MKTVEEHNISSERIWELLNEVPDPEVPVISVVELGVVRKVEIAEKGIEVTITPTYTGCPAMRAIEESIVERLKEAGITGVKIKTVLSPAWTTEWLTPETRQKLKEYGIAPPERVSMEQVFPFLASEKKPVACPRCDSTNTVLKSFFGSTACKALHFCKDCREPFDYFKCI